MCNSDIETRLLDAAEALVRQQGLLSFPFSQLAKDAGCSMGTLYKHFSNREDLMLALLSRHLSARLQQQTELLSSELSPAEMWLAITLLPFQPKDTLFTSIDIMAQLPQIRQQANQARREQLQQRLSPYCHSVKQLLQRAKIQGKLHSDDEQVSQTRITVLAIQKGAKSLPDVALEGEENTPLAGLPLYRSLFTVINTLRWQQPLNADSYLRIQKQLNRL